MLGAGYIGAELVRQLLAQGYEVVAFDNLFSTDEQALRNFANNPAFKFIQGSVTSSDDLDRAFAAAKPLQAVFNLAAQASGNPAAATPEYTEETNLRGPRLVCEVARRYGVNCLVYASSTRVYGDPLPARVNERTPYGRFADLSHLSKCYAEKLLEMHCADGKLAGLSLRLGLTFGVSPVMKTDYRFMTAPNKFALQAVRSEKIVVGSGSWLGAVHVGDAARALIFAAERLAKPGYQVFNAAPIVTRIDQIAQIVAVQAGQRGQPVEIEMKAVPSGEAVTPKIRSRLDRLGFRPQKTLEEGLAETLDYFLARLTP